jgi:hypothetical protein
MNTAQQNYTTTKKELLSIVASLKEFRNILLGQQIRVFTNHRKRKGKKDLHLWCLTMIDLATGWFEMQQISNKTAAEVADICETTWFTRYPLPQ